METTRIEHFENEKEKVLKSFNERLKPCPHTVESAEDQLDIYAANLGVQKDELFLLAETDQLSNEMNGHVMSLFSIANSSSN